MLVAQRKAQNITQECRGKESSSRWNFYVQLFDINSRILTPSSEEQAPCQKIPWANHMGAMHL